MFDWYHNVAKIISSMESFIYHCMTISQTCRMPQPCTNGQWFPYSAAWSCQGELDSCWLQWPSSDGGQICTVQSVWSRDHLPADWWWHPRTVLRHHYPAQPDPVCVEGGGVQWPLLAGCEWCYCRHNRQFHDRWTLEDTVDLFTTSTYQVVLKYLYLSGFNLQRRCKIACARM